MLNSFVVFFLLKHVLTRIERERDTVGLLLEFLFELILGDEFGLQRRLFLEVRVVVFAVFVGEELVPVLGLRLVIWGELVLYFGGYELLLKLGIPVGSGYFVDGFVGCVIAEELLLIL